LQQQFLQTFASLPDHEQFYLTGGTALAEYYLGHRLSYDLDLFTSVDGLVQPASYQLEDLVKKHGLGIKVVRRFSSYAEFEVMHQEDKLRIDLALDSPFRFETPVICKPGIRVNSYIDLCVDKLLAYYGRSEPRDAVDLFFILQSRPADVLFKQAVEKDPGFDAYWLSIALDRCLSSPDEPGRWPVKMLLDWDPKQVKILFHDWAMQLMQGIQH